MATTNPQHTVLSFGEMRLPIAAIERVFQLALRWNDHFGLVPTLMATEHDRKLLRFPNSAKKLEGRGFSENSSFSIFCLPDDVEHELQGYNSHFFLDFRYKQLIIDFRSVVCVFLAEDFFILSKEFAEVVCPSYGFAYQRPFDLGPTYFAMGAEKGDITDEEGESIAGWIPARKFGYIAHGFVRDIFQWNCLSRVHLNRRIGGTTLERWIGAESYRGKLHLFAADTCTWQVEEKHMPRIRQELTAADIIFDHMKHLQTPAAHYHEQGVRGELGYENVAARVFLELGLPTKVKPAPKIAANLFVEPPLPPTSPEEALQAVMEQYGYESEEEARVIKSLGEGKTKELSKDQIREIIQKNKKKGRKAGK